MSVFTILKIFSVVLGLLQSWTQSLRDKKMVNGEVAIRILNNINACKRDLADVEREIKAFRDRIAADPDELRRDDGFERKDK